MTDIAVPTRFERPSALSFLGYAAGILIFLWALNGAGFSMEKILSSPPRFADFAVRAFPPNLAPDVLERLGGKMVETLQIAFAGAAIGCSVLTCCVVGGAGAYLWACCEHRDPYRTWVYPCSA